MIASIESQNKKIAKNTIMLYLRMALSMMVSLYSSRVILQVLGVNDYGLWNVVSGIVVMFQFLNSSMSGCSSRFISYEIGKGADGQPQNVFSAALTIHIILAFVIITLCESVGLWFLYNKLVVPIDRMNSAFIIFQLSVIGSFFTVTQVPYNASIIANERMNVFAYIELINVGLRLLILYLLVILPGDHLIVYGILTLCISVFIACLYRFYCMRYLNHCRFRLSFDAKIIKPMMSFSLWDLYGNGAVMARTQGVNMLLNMFFSVATNAASAVATSVQNAVMSFATNIIAAFRPQIVKNYAGDNWERMSTLINKAAIYTAILLLLFSIPLWVEMEYVLKIWLKSPPENALPFCRLVLFFNFFANFSTILVSGIHATGKIVRTSFINGTLYLLVIPFSYVAFKEGAGPNIAYCINIIAVCLGMVQNVFVLKKNVPVFSIAKYLRIVAKLTMTGVALLAISLVLIDLLESSFIRVCIVAVLNTFLLISISFVWILDSDDEKIIKTKMMNVFRRVK